MMKNAFIIGILILLPLVIQAQEDSTVLWNDIPLATEREDDDQFAIRRQSDVYRMTSVTFLDDINDRVDAINTEIESATSHPGNTNNPHMVTDAQVLPTMTTKSGDILTNNGTLSFWTSTPTLDTLYLTGGGKLYADASGNIVFEDEQTDPVPLTDLTGEWTGVADSSSVTYEVDTLKSLSGSNIAINGSLTVPSITGKYGFGTGSDYIYQNSSQGLSLNIANTVKMQWGSSYIYVYTDFGPVSSSKTYDLGSKIFFWDSTFTDALVIDNDSMSINATGEGADKEFQFHDPKNGDYTASEMLTGGDSSDSSWISIDIDTLNGPIVVTDDINFPEEKAVNFRSNNTIFSPGSSTLRLTAGGNAAFDFSSTINTTYHSIIPSTNNTFTLGDNTHSFTQAYINTVYLSSSSYSVGIVGNDIAFTSPDAGTVYLDDLSGGGSSGDTVSADRYIHLLCDTTSFTFGFGLGLAGDTTGCVDGAILGAFPNQQDTLVALMIDDAIAKNTNANVNVRILYDVNPYDPTPTVIWSGTVTTTASSSTSFTTKKIPPNTHIWAEINGTPTNKATHIYLPFEFAKISQ